MKITGSIHMIKGLVSNQYLLVDLDKLILIDAGINYDSSRILKYIEKIGFVHTDLKIVLLTHSDADHFGGANAIRRLTNAKVYASEIEAKSIEKGESSRALKPKGLEKTFYSMANLFMHNEPTGIDDLIKENQELPFLGGLLVLNTAGHTPGHYSFFNKRNRILFSGDSIIISGNKIMPSMGANTWNEEMAQESFNIQSDLNAKIIAGGHGYLINA